MPRCHDGFVVDRLRGLKVGTLPAVGRAARGAAVRNSLPDRVLRVSDGSTAVLGHVVRETRGGDGSGGCEALNVGGCWNTDMHDDFGT
jgi:hypothetical protein